MTLQEYLEFTRTTAIYAEALSGAVPELMYLSLGLAGESGEVANQVKKIYRDGDNSIRREKITSELGDVFWYLCRLCDALNLSPEDVLNNNVEKLRIRQARGVIGGDGEKR